MYQLGDFHLIWEYHDQFERALKESLALVHKVVAMQKKVNCRLNIKSTVTEWIMISGKLCLNLYSLRWLKDVLSIGKNFNLSRLRMPNTDLDDRFISLRIVFLKLNNEVELRMLISSLFLSHITFGKKKLKSNCPSLQRGILRSRTCLDIPCKLGYSRVKIWKWSNSW